MILRALLCLTLLLYPALLSAAETPILYSRTSITIMRRTPPTLPWQDKQAAQPDSGLPLEVEVRDASALYNQSGWYNLSSYSDRQGVLITFAAPEQKHIIPSSQYAPVDILFIDQEGQITQIIPNLLLSDLQQDIVPEKPVMAFLFVKGGTCAQLSINPGDVVLYKLFKRPPLVLSAPTPITPTPVTTPTPLPTPTVNP